MLTPNIKSYLYAALLLSFSVYTLFIYTQDRSQTLSSEDAANGRRIWQERNCGACHQIYGLGGFLGPDLTNVNSAPGKGPDFIKAFVRSGTTVMPAFKISDDELNYLVAFLAQVDASGYSDPRKFKRNSNGTIE